MATLFDSASLALIPSGVKESKVYSIKPTDGSGDFTFTRGTDTATRVNSSGLIEKERSNQLLQSNTFDTTWATSSASVTSGQSGYDGSSDAWLLESASAGGSYVVQNVSTSGVVSFSVYAKANTSNFLNLNLTGGTYFAWFDLSTGATGTINGASIDSSIESVGSGWYRCTIVAEGSNTSFRIYLTDANGSTSSAAGNSIYIQDAQVNQGLAAQPYQETTTTAVYGGITDNLPRLDYSGGATCPSLLLEPSRSNGIAQSEYFESWTQDGITTSSNTTDTLSPEGLYNASKITAVSGNQRIYVGSTHLAGIITGSFYVKAGTTDVITFNASSFLITYNLTTLAVTETIGTGTITSVGNGWYRVTATSAVSASANRTPQIVINTASAGEYLYIYGAMIGVGNYETSYIPTYGTSASRAKDKSEVTGLGSVLGSTEGTIFLEVSALTNALSVGLESRFSLSNGTTSNVVRVGFTSVNNRIIAVLYNGANQCVLTYAGADITQTNKIAFTYAANDFALYVNGESRATDTFGTTFTAATLTEVHFDRGDGNGSESLGNFDQVLIFPTRLTNAELAALTTI
jgi:hypothetical protein